jgi:AraC-like DNA-binding protein
MHGPVQASCTEVLFLRRSRIVSRMSGLESEQRAGEDAPMIKVPTTRRSAEMPRSELALGPRLALTVVHGSEVPLFAHAAPVHCVLVGRMLLAHSGRRYVGDAFALPPLTAHTVLSSERGRGVLAYLDARRYRFEDAQRLTRVLRGFVPGRDDPREAFGDALKLPRRRLDPRLETMLDSLECADTDVAEAAHRAGLSGSRATHLMTEKLGAPPRMWRPWLRLRNAIGEVAFRGATLTQAAHRAGFFDAAHLTRTCKAMLGVSPRHMVSPTVFATHET